MSDGPVIDYLRISITDRCNLRCVYCMPSEGVEAVSHDDVLKYEELELFARAAVLAGIRKVRVTGGEPLVRKGAVDFIGSLASIEPGLKLSLTTNGVLLEKHAADLKRAGLRRVNVSLDSLDPDTYRRVTRTGELSAALAGLDAAMRAGLDPVKVNVVLLKGMNDDPLPFAELTRDRPVHVRFIEYMPHFGSRNGDWCLPVDSIQKRLAGEFELEPVEPPEGWGPARYARIRGAAGTVGFISPVSCHFCSSCNRLRISAEGRMKTCLYDTEGVDVRAAIRSGADEAALREIIAGELERKKAEGRRAPPRAPAGGCEMSRIGG